MAAASEGVSLYTSPSIYAMLFAERTCDIAFYRQLASERGSPVLELGIGTGRVAIPLAESGHTVAGVEPACSMIEALQARQTRLDPAVRARIDVQQCEAHTMRLPGRFPLAIFPFNGLAHCSDGEQLHLTLTRIREHLLPNGWFAFDVLRPDPSRLAGYESSIPWFRHPETLEVCRADERVRYDPTSGLVEIELSIRFMESSRAEQHLVLRFRQFTEEEISIALTRANFTPIRAAHDFGDATAYVVS